MYTSSLYETAPREVGGTNDVTVSNRVNLVDPMSKHWPVKPRPIGSNKTCNEHVLNKYSVRTRYFRESRSMRAEYKRGVVRPEVLDHAHKYGG